MSNIAGKSYAMNVITPMKWYIAFFRKILFYVLRFRIVSGYLKGLLTLSLIHYARWVIVKDSQFPRLSKSQPKEKLKYHYMLFFSNFNGSWDQYVDSFSSSIPIGLNLFWRNNIKYPKSVPFTPFHNYITYNQIWTNYYYNAYPLASSNDVKAAKKVRENLLDFNNKTQNFSAQEFKKEYDILLLDLQNDLGQMGSNPIVSLANAAVEERYRKEKII